VASERSEGLRQALSLTPDNHALRLILAETLAAEGLVSDAAAEYRLLLDQDAIPVDELIPASRVALAAGDLALAGDLADAGRRAGIVEGVAELRRAIDSELGLEGVMQIVRHEGPDGMAPPFEFESAQTTTFSDIGGLDEIKKTIHRTIILPFQRADLYERYGRRVGGGVLLYGPPGCGKTMLARATATECGLPFSNVRIEEIVDPYFGISEQNLHEVFDQARRAAPCVLFLDEIDAIGFARRKHTGSVGRQLVDQLLQELDSIGSENEGMLVLAATNAPWDVDEAIKRPGRFDRLVFVPPPDEAARLRILEILISGRPTEGVDPRRLARQTPLFSGADLEALVNRAIDAAIDDALESGTDRPLGMADFESAITRMRPSTLEWLATARNYVEFANKDGSYDEVMTFLVSKEARAGRRQA
jgi:ATP-dependent 26S proteasome regulatory subunit